MPYIGKQPSKVPLTSADIVDGTISNDDLAGSITDAKIVGLTASKLSGVVPTANLGTGTASSSTVLYGDGTYKAEPVTDTTSIKNDISLLALQNAINGNLSAYGLKNSWIEQFEDSTKIDNLTTCDRAAIGEYVASVYSVNGAFTSDANTKLLMHMDDSALTTDSGATGHTITNSSVTRSSTKSKYGGYSAYFNGSSNLTAPNHADWSFGTGDMTIEFWFFPMSASHGGMFDLNKYSTQLPVINISTWELNVQYYGSLLITNVNDSLWHHVASVRDSNVVRSYLDGVQLESAAYSTSQASGNGIIIGNYYNGSFPYTGYIDELRVSNVARYPNGTTFTPNNVSTVSATGSFTSTDIVPQDTTNKSSVGLVLLYKDGGSSNCTLNTDIVAQVRANTGQAYQTLALAGAGTYSDSLKIAIAPAISVTAGQALSYKISFANQAVGTKEAQIHGVAMTY